MPVLTSSALPVHGAQALPLLLQGAPDMNSLVGLGATAAFGISAVAALAPQLGWRTFFEEPAMLLGVVLVRGWGVVGRARAAWAIVQVV